MFEYLMPKNKIIKLKIYLYFIENNHNIIKIDELSSIMQLTIHSLRRYIKEIGEDLSSIADTPHIIKLSTNEYTLNKNTLNYNLIFEELKCSYLNISKVYKMAYLFCQRPAFSLNQLSEKLIVSRSITYKTIEQLNELLALYDIEIKKNNHQKFILVGEEANIRLFAFDFLKQCLKKNEWPFIFSKKFIEQLTYQSFNNFPIQSMDEFILLNGVVFNRIQFGYYLNFTSNDEIFLKCKQIFKTNLSFHTGIDNYINNEETILAEKNFFLLIVFNLFPETISSDIFKQFLKKNYSDTLFHSEKKLLDYIQFETIDSVFEEKSYVSYHQYYLRTVLSNLFPTVHYNILLSLTFPTTYYFNIENFDFRYLKQNIFIHQLYKKHSLKNKNYSQNNHNQQLYLCHLLTHFSFFIKEKLKKKIKVFIDFQNDYFAKEFLLNKLLNTYSSELLHITTCKDEADIVILNYLADNLENKHIFINNIYSNSNWNIIHHYLHNLITHE